MADNQLTGNPTPGALPGLRPLVEAAVHQALAQHVTEVAAGAVADGLGEPDLGSVADHIVQRELIDLAKPPGPVYPTLADWVGKWLMPLYRRSIKGHERVWCPEWWLHDEAIARLEALWRAWENLRLDAATGMSVWFRDHADHHMTILLDADGPFKGCDPTHSERPLQPLPHDPPPPGTFEADDDFMPSAPSHAPAVATGYSPDVGRSLKMGRVR